MTYGLYTHSHWQGAGIGAQIAYHDDEALVKAVRDTIRCCSFCGSARRLGYCEVGTCYVVRETRRPCGLRLPDDAGDWSSHDLMDLLWDADK